MDLNLEFIICCCLFCSCNIQAGVSPPSWSQNSETTSVLESATAGTPVTVTSTVINSADTVEILGTSTGTDATTLFSASASGTSVNVTTAGVLDRETTAQFVLVLRATNGGGNTGTEPNFGDLELTVNIGDINDNAPVFSPASKCKEMGVGTSGPTSVDYLNATDADDTGNALGATPYSFSVNPTKYDIVAATGEVKVKAGETLSAGHSTLEIKATDEGAPQMVGTGTLTVCVGMLCCSTGCCSGAPALHVYVYVKVAIIVSVVIMLHHFSKSV